jgi:hypothetical protein
VLTVLCAAVVFAFLGARHATGETRDDAHANGRAHDDAPVRRRTEPACAETNAR